MKSQGLMEKIFKVLSHVVDPATGLDIVRMRIIKDLRADAEGKVKLILHPSSPVCPLAYKVAADIKLAIKGIKGVKEVEMQIEGFKDAAKLEALLREI